MWREQIVERCIVGGPPVVSAWFRKTETLSVLDSFCLLYRLVVHSRLKRDFLLPCLCWIDVIYMHASLHCQHALDTVDHGAPRFITNLKALHHYCTLYSWAGWSALSSCELKHWHILIYKAVLGLLPSYGWTYILKKSRGSYCVHCQDLILLTVIRACSELGENVCRYAASYAWNRLQNCLNLKQLLSLNLFKLMLNIQDTETFGCKCFDWSLLPIHEDLWKLDK